MMERNSLLKRIANPQCVLFVGVFVLFMIVGRTQLFRDPGTFFHTVMGEQIWHSFQLPRTDPFSLTHGGRPWIAQQWLGEVLMYLTYACAQWDGLLLVTVTLLAFLSAWLFRRLHSAGLSLSLSLLIIAFYLAAGSHHYHVRPHMASLLLFGITFARLSDYEAGRLKAWRLWLLVPLFILWTNLHGAVIGGLGTLGLAIAGWALSEIFLGISPVKNWKEWGILLGLLLAGISSVLVNPYGWQMPQVWLAIMNSPAVHQTMEEHASLIRAGTWPILLLAFFYVAALLGTLPQRPRVTWLLPLVWLYLAWSRNRNGPFFALAATLALADLFPHVRWAKWFSQKGSRIFALRAPAPATGLGFRPVLPALLLLAAGLGLQAGSVRAPLLGHGWVEMNRNYWPVDFLAELKSCASGPGTPILNDMRFGGFLLFQDRRFRVFIDDRCELYGDQFLLEYATAQPAQIAKWIERYGFEIALAEPDSALDRYLRGQRQWKLRSRSPAAALYRRTGQAPPDWRGMARAG